MKTLYIHIGTPKTGTTAIQAFLEANTDALYKNGYIFRFFPFKYKRSVGSIPKKRNAYFLHGDTVPNDPQGNRSNNIDRLMQGLSLIRDWFSEKDNVIITDEFLWNEMIRWSFMDDVKSFCDENGILLRLVVYLRPQDEYVDSFYRQRTKMADTTASWTEYLNSTDIVTDYEGHLRQLSEKLGKDSLVVRPYEPKEWAKDGKDIFKDFLSAIGTEFSDDYQLPPGESNLSLKYNDSEIKRILNHLHKGSSKADNDTDLFFRRKAKECSVLIPDQEKFSFFSDQEREAYMERFREGNDRVAREYCGRDVLFAPKKSGKVPWRSDNAYMQEDIILFFGNVTDELFREIEKLKKDNERLKRFSIGYRFCMWLRKLFRRK